MKRNIKAILTLAVVTLLSFSLSAQTLHSSYFMTEMTGRHRLNPALKTSNHYIGMPVLNDVYAGLNSNLGLGTFLYPQGDKLVTFLHESVDAKGFLSKLSKNNAFEVDFGVDLLNFGFWAWGGQNTFDLAVKGGVGFYLPKDLFQFLKTGQESTGITEYHMGNMSAIANSYVELALGHSHDINKKVSVGARLKLLVGAAYGELKIDQMDLTMSQEEWRIKETGHMMLSSLLATETDPETGEVKNIAFSPKLELPGAGLGVDLGVTYKPIKNLTLSLAATDIGFMRWNNISYAESDPNNEFVYNGFDNIGTDNSEMNSSIEALGDDLAGLLKFYQSDSKTMDRLLHSTLRVGAEYGVMRDKISFGLLSTTRFFGEKVYAEGMATVNFRPFSALHITVNGSYANVGGWSCGGIINICAPGFNLFVGTDFIAGNYSKEFIPIDKAHLNACVGLSFTFGKKRQY